MKSAEKVGEKREQYYNIQYFNPIYAGTRLINAWEF